MNRERSVIVQNDFVINAVKSHCNAIVFSEDFNFLAVDITECRLDFIVNLFQS